MIRCGGDDAGGVVGMRKRQGRVNERAKRLALYCFRKREFVVKKFSSVTERMHEEIVREVFEVDDT